MQPARMLTCREGRIRVGIPRVAWLGDPGLALWSLVIVDVWNTTAFVALLVLAGLACPTGLAGQWVVGAQALLFVIVLRPWRWRELSRAISPGIDVLALLLVLAALVALLEPRPFDASASWLIDHTSYFPKSRSAYRCRRCWHSGDRRPGWSPSRCR